MKSSEKIKSAAPRCWCGNRRLDDFSPDYFRCTTCETLVVKNFPDVDLTHIKDEETDIYGANYAEHHLQETYGQPDFATRARRDLTERCLHWLDSILAYSPPPGKLLELGSFHGAFVGLAQLAGYDAKGLDLSPLLARKASAMFGVPILTGPVEDQSISPGSLNVIALFDVLEHLQDPCKTVNICRRLLGPDGVIVIQTPQYQEGRTFDQMQASKDPFLSLLIPREHLYLFSQKAVKMLLTQNGLPYVNFERALFASYDMFLVASASDLKKTNEQSSRSALLLSPGGRFTTALLDLKLVSDNLLLETHRLNLHAQRSDQDAGARADQVEKLTSLVQTYRHDADARAIQIEQLDSLARHHEAEAAARLVQVHQLTELVKKHETESLAREAQILKLTDIIKPLEIAATERLKQIESYAGWLQDAQRANELITSAHRDAEKTVESLQVKIEEQASSYLTQSEKLTEQLQTPLRRAQLEASLANQLLGLSSALPPPVSSQWIQLPLPVPETVSTVTVVSNLEAVERDTHRIRISGWAFADESNAVTSDPPFLIFATSNTLWLLQGNRVDRPDVSAAYSVGNATAAARLQSGFVFEFPPNQLPPSSAYNLQIIFAQVSGLPILTPRFSLP